jgi:hypothetical protein
MLFLFAVLLWSSLNVFGISWGVVVFLVTIASAFCICWSEQLGIAALLAVLVDFVCIFGLHSPAPRAVDLGGLYPSCSNNMKCIALALNEYHKANGCFPPAYIADKNGRRMHSWRVLILPYIDKAYYERYDFDEPWDAPNNRSLQSFSSPRHRLPLDWFICPDDNHPVPGKPVCANYLAVVGPGSAWRGQQSMTLKDCQPADQSILLVEVADSDIVWTEPRDYEAGVDSSPHSWTISSKHGPKEEFFYVTPFGGANVALVDGGVHFVSGKNLSVDRLPELLNVGGFPKAYEPVSAPPGINWPNCLALVVWLLSVGWLQYRAWQARRRMLLQMTNIRGPVTSL